MLSILASLNHPNIAQIHGIEEAGPLTDSGPRWWLLWRAFAVSRLLPDGTRLGHYDGGSALHLAQRCPAPAQWDGNATVWRFPRRTSRLAKAV